MSEFNPDSAVAWVLESSPGWAAVLAVVVLTPVVAWVQEWEWVASEAAFCSAKGVKSAGSQLMSSNLAWDRVSAVAAILVVGAALTGAPVAAAVFTRERWSAMSAAVAAAN